MPGVAMAADDAAMRSPARADRRSTSRWSDAGPAILRRRRGRGFSYVDAKGRRLTERATRERIASLAIPPAWTEVRINPDAAGRLQAVGRDARGRKQYRYRPSYRAARERAKFRELVAFGAALPSIRRRVAADLRRRGLVQPRVVALLVRLLDLTAMRVGNDAYRRANRSFGLTTLGRSHARVRGTTVTFHYRGKGGKVQEATVRDRQVARLVRQLIDAHGRRLFVDRGVDGRLHAVRSVEVNDYLQAIAGPAVSAKAFRTWGATVLACRVLIDASGSPPTKRPGRRRRASPALKAALAEVADHLGDTPTVVRESYVHPAIVAAHEADELPTLKRRRRTAVDAPTGALTGLSMDEQRTLEILRAASRTARDGQSRTARL